jgi:hypothetical protein
MEAGSSLTYAMLIFLKDRTSQDSLQAIYTTLSKHQFQWVISLTSGYTLGGSVPSGGVPSGGTGVTPSRTWVVTRGAWLGVLYLACVILVPDFCVRMEPNKL